MCMEKYFTVCGIGNGGGIIVDSIYQQYAINGKELWKDSSVDLMAIGNAWDLKELSVINKVKGKVAQISFTRITVFIACLGGDTMPALLPYYIEMAKQQNSHVLVCFTLPFAVEGKERNPVPAKIIGKAELGLPNMLCSETFLAIGPFESEDEAKSVIKYTQTKFFRILVGARKLKNMTSGTYKFVPLQDFTNNSDID